MSDTGPGMSRFSDSWGWVALATVSRGYLALVLGLAAIAILPALLGWQSSVVQSGSMEPHIRPGDVTVTTTLPDNRAVPVGRVVAFRNPASAEADGHASIRLHRVVSDNGDGTFVTRGDANRDADSTPITREQIVGQARLLIPAIGLPDLWLTTGRLPTFVAWCLGTLLAIVVVAIDTPNDRRRPSPAAPGRPSDAGLPTSTSTTSVQSPISTR